MRFRRRDRVEPEPTEETIEVQLYSSEPEPPKYKVPVAKRLGLFAFYGGLSYVSLKIGEHYVGVHPSIVFELGQSAIAGTVAAACMVKAVETHEVKRSEASAPIE